MGTRHIYFLDLRPSCVAGEATEPFAPKHATTGASISHLQSSYSDLQCRYFIENCAKKGYSNARIEQAWGIQRASIQEGYICSYLDASPSQMLLPSIFGQLGLECRIGFTSARYRNRNYPLQHMGNLFRGALGFQSAGMQQAGSQCGDSLCTGQRTCGRESSFEILHAARILSRTTSGYPPGGMAVG